LLLLLLLLLLLSTAQLTGHTGTLNSPLQVVSQLLQTSAALEL
jgi:hypothetical protein